MREVRFAQYRRYEARRVEASNAMMALLAGAGMASHLLQLTTIRLMRNCMIHEGGRADQTLLNDLAAWTSSIEAGWVKLTGNNPRQLRPGAELSFGHGEMILALAVTKVLAREANRLLQPALPRSQWADMLIADLVDSDTKILRASTFADEHAAWRSSTTRRCSSVTMSWPMPATDI